MCSDSGEHEIKRRDDAIAITFEIGDRGSKNVNGKRDQLDGMQIAFFARDNENGIETAIGPQKLFGDKRRAHSRGHCEAIRLYDDKVGSFFFAAT